jgi:hypothetical protein
VLIFAVNRKFRPVLDNERPVGVPRRAFAEVRRQIVTLPANCSQSRRPNCEGGVSYPGVCNLTYQIVAIRENETVKCERNSVLIAIAKARVWASEGWQVVVTDSEGKTLEPAEFDRLLAA